MSHIHIPDGVLPVWLWASGWLAALAAVAIAGRVAGRADVRRKVPLLGIVSALMLVAMSSEVIPIAYHINLTVLAGALLGPALSIVAAFIVEVVLAMLGHGGVTVIGLNTVVISTEMVLGWALLHGLVRLVGRTRVRSAAFAATVVALAISTTLMVGIVALAGVSGATQRETGALNPVSLRFANPLGGGVVSIGLFGGGEEADTAEQEPETLNLSVRRFAAVVYTLGPLGWLLEGLVTAAVIGYVARLRPDLVFAGPLAERASRFADDTHRDV